MSIRYETKRFAVCDLCDAQEETTERDDGSYHGDPRQSEKWGQLHYRLGEIAGSLTACPSCYLKAPRMTVYLWAEAIDRNRRK